MREILFILGAPSSGTSTVVSVLNRAPEVLMLYEVEFDRGAEATHRNHEFVQAMPEARGLFDCGDDLVGALSRYGDMLKTRGFAFRTIGAKLLSTPTRLLDRFDVAPCICCVRDLRTWAVKNKILREHYPVRYPQWRHNIVPALTDYVGAFIESFRLERRLTVRLEDIVAFPERTIGAVAAFSGQAAALPSMLTWWQSEDLPSGHPKAMSDWQEAHASATLMPVALDTTVTLAPHVLWDRLVPIFLKYFETDRAVAPAEIARDLEEVARIKHDTAARIEDLYASFRTKSLQEYLTATDGKRMVRSRGAMTFEPGQDLGSLL